MVQDLVDYFVITTCFMKEIYLMTTDFEGSVMERFDLAVQETFPEGVVDMKFCVNGRGTTEDAMKQVIETLRQYRLGETRPYMDY